MTRSPRPGSPTQPPQGIHRNRLAGLFYGGIGLCAVLWNALAGRPWWRLLWDPQRATLALAAAGAGVGAAIGLVVVGLSRLSVRLRWGRELYEWFAGLLGPVSWRDALYLAALSALAEEALFRGAMQLSLGLGWTSLLFGLLHLPPRLRLAGWTAAAGGLGLAFGVLTTHSGNLAGAVIGHFVINLINLRYVSAFVGGMKAGVAGDGGVAPRGGGGGTNA